MGIRRTSRESLAAAPLFGALALLAALACAPTPASPPDARPNLVLVTVEALRADRLGSYGFPLDTTPAMDALAASGVRFERAIAAANLAPPGLASILTSSFSRDPVHAGADGEAVESLAERLGRAGYQTAAFVTGSSLEAPVGLERGFDTYQVLTGAPQPGRESADASARPLTRAAIDWQRGVDRGPFFLWVHYRDPHGPYTPLPPDKGRFRVKPTAAARPLPILSDDSGRGGIPAFQALPRARYATEYESRQADEIRATDQQLARLIDSVDTHASGRPAVIVLTGVFGESFGENDRWFVHHHATTPEVAHIPLILRAPDLAPSVRAETVHHVDIAPTLLDAAGLTPSANAAGLALAPRVRGELPFPERHVYCDMQSEFSAYDATGFTRATHLQANTTHSWSHWAWHPEMPPIRLPDPTQISPALLDHANSPAP